MEHDAEIARVVEYGITIDALQDDVASFRNLLTGFQQDPTLNSQGTHRVEEVAQKVTELEASIIRKAETITNHFIEHTHFIYLSLISKMMLYLHLSLKGIHYKNSALVIK